ncbi:MAG: peptide deformylase [Paracoccaceae bacterium]|jgi:peptide deformylase
MAVRPILLWPDARLSQVCAPLEHVDDGVRRLVADMIETMYDAKGRGLAAPQIGVLQRVFVMDCAPKDAPAAPQVFCNPEIIDQSDAISVYPEGCLSIPDMVRRIARPAEIRLRWYDHDGVANEAPFDGIEATCIQHELDHLNGVVTLDHTALPEDAPEESAA